MSYTDNMIISIMFDKHLLSLFRSHISRFFRKHQELLHDMSVAFLCFSITLGLTLSQTTKGLLNPSQVTLL